MILDNLSEVKERDKSKDCFTQKDIIEDFVFQLKIDPSNKSSKWKW